MKKETVDNDEIIDIVIEIGEEDKTIEDLKIDYPNEIEKLEGALIYYIAENDPKFLKLELSDKWKYLTKKLAYPFECFISIEDYQQSIDNFK